MIPFKPAVSPPAEPTKPAWWLPFSDDKLLVKEEGEQSALLTLAHQNPTIPTQFDNYLGQLHHQDTFTTTLPADYTPPDGFRLSGLRGLFGRLPTDQFWLAVRAHQITAWDRNHQFCGRCSTPMHKKETDRSKLCPQCGLTTYPRISPAIIVAITRGDEILLARSTRSRHGIYSVLAGFVEPGETLEQCVHREVFEEVGLYIKDVTYFGSQPWPFPDSLMLGFTATYKSGEIVLQDDEISTAGWFPRDALPPIPPSISIARRLIDAFVNS
ncbi:MAG TPA: NAD(+) diphosphatase [Anaerolineae bacterium]|nr:NAD(+) diphosphatase [Anaerolineae bacterium]